MIKQAHTLMDARHIINLMRQFLNETSYSQAAEASNDVEHLGRLAFTFMQKGYVWLAFVDELPVGILIAVKEPNLWSPKNIQLRELVWYVVPQHRKTSIGGRLFAKYCETAELLINQNLIDGYFTTRMTTTDPVGLERRGFKLKESTYLKERT
jgi:hypothetical protein